MDIEKAINIIQDELRRPYCDNCIGSELQGKEHENQCDDCHRKYFNWKISEGKARKIAEKILVK